MQIPTFVLYGTNETFEIDVRYLKPVNLSLYRHELEGFTRYIFEDVFDRMHTNDRLIFDLDKSPVKCLVCLLTESNEIDRPRMSAILSTKNQNDS